ncbi:MAG: DUF1302 domain-containing protein [Moraxellaceae bacterium]|nr:DUF1302 domain-containing protein [Moraxellaceae bacterium]
MKKKNGLQSIRMAPRAAGFALATLLPLAVSSANAFELNLGAVTGSLDTTVSYGTGWRMEAQDPKLATLYPNYTAAVMANRRSFIHKSDGDANFDNDSKPISSVYKITSDLELKWDNFGAFARGTAFYDTVLSDEKPNRSFPSNFPNSASCNAQSTTTPAACGFPSELDDRVSHDARFLDAYVYGNFDLGGRALNVRLGEQVINWGEALFLQDGINNANPVSLAKLRLPGAEVKEALLPLPMLYASMELADSLTLEGFLEFDWDYSEADGVGTFYSTDDAFAGDGANRILVDMTGSALQTVSVGYNSVDSSGNPTGLLTPVLTNKRETDKAVDAAGQFGLALRYSAGDTEYGLYYVNYHSHKPVAQAITGEMNGVQALNPQALAAMNACILAGVDPAGLCQAKANAAHYLDTTRYQVMYPEDIQMIGLSFSTTLGDLSVSGELAYRPNDVILSELGDNLVAYNTLNAIVLGNGGTATAGEVNGGQAFGANQVVSDYIEVESYNLDLVAINNFGPMIGADQVVGVVEAGASYIPAADDGLYASTASLLYVDPAHVPGGIANSSCAAGPVPKVDPASCLSEGPKNDYMDAVSWGYRVVLSATYNDAFAGVAVTPSIRFAHDVDGNSHRTGNFLENRKSGTVAVNGVYNNALDVGVAYNAFWGAEASNLLGDRDNITLTLKYSF